MIEYSILKTLHLGALIFWLGPAIGSWLVLRYSQKQTGETSETSRLIYKVFFFTVTLEHIAFVFLLITGIAMATLAQSWSQDWLQQKLIILVLTIIPLEIIDIVLGNWLLNKLIKKRNTGIKLNQKEEKYIRHYHTTFTYAALLILPIGVLMIMWLAISKTPITL